MVAQDLPFMAERSVLGSAMMSPDAAVIVCEELRSEHFLNPSLRTVFEGIQYSLDKGLSIDAISMTDLLQGKIEHDYVFLFLQALTEQAIISSVKDHCAIVKNQFARSRLGVLAEGLTKRLEVGTSSADDLVRFVDDEIIKLQQESDSASLTGGRLSAKDMFSKFNNWLVDEAEVTFPFPFAKLNDQYVGYARGEVVVIFGYSSDGKSVLGFQFLDAIMEMEDLRIGVFSLEMSDLQLARRMLSSETEPFWKIRNRELSQVQLSALQARADKLGALNMDVYNGQRTSEQIARDTLRNKYDVILVDHLHRMPYKNRMELEEHMRNLKSLAIRADCAVICLAQTSRAKTSKPEDQFPEPNTNQLRDSDAIMQEADWAVSVWQKRNESNARIPSKSRIRIQKARDGEADAYIDAKFRPALMEFVPVDGDDDGAYEQTSIEGEGYTVNVIPDPVDTGLVF